jgi:hypothetical protein
MDETRHMAETRIQAIHKLRQAAVEHPERHTTALQQLLAIFRETTDQIARVDVTVPQTSTTQNCSGDNPNGATTAPTQRGFKIVAFNGDNEFEALREHLSPTPLNVVARGKHVGPIERLVRTIKERVRCSCQSLPYKKITRLMTRSIVESSVTWLNAFPAKEGA